MRQGNVQPEQGISEVPFENVCTCKACSHDLARDCIKSDCSCCKKESHTMVMDGIEGFSLTDRQQGSHGKQLL